MKKQFKNNVVYLLRIDHIYYYIGCHCWKCRQPFTSGILSSSGNFLNRAVQRHEISRDEYNKRVELLRVEGFDSPEDALNREANLIKEYQRDYGNYCLNKSLGNKYGQRGLIRSEETKMKISGSLKGHITSEEHKKKISDSQEKTPVLQYSKDGKFISEYPSIREAARQTGITYKNICPCCKGKLRSAGGYIWKYKNV